MKQLNMSLLQKFLLQKLVIKTFFRTFKEHKKI